jgi:AraC-like DNA-binding protein
LVVEEEVLSLLHEVLATTYRFWEPGVDRGLVRPEPDPRDVATRARLVLAETCCENHSLSDIARRVGVSPFYLCRSFRAATGSTLHAYRTDLRLREALNRLGDHGRDLTGLALDLGFSSHSHFTAAFRRAFGATPSSVRRQVESNAARR